MNVSTFQNTTRPTFFIESAPPDMQYVHFSLKNLPLIKVFDAIKKSTYKKQIQHVHTLQGGYSTNKKKLPCFTPSGTFRIRCDWDLIEYSHIVHLDYDKVQDAAALRDRVAKSPYCFAAFISPSGFGVKVFVKVNSNVDLHAHAWSQVRQVFDAVAGITSDPTGRNLSRLCFISADAGLYFNPDAQTFEVVEPKRVVTVPDLSILASNANSLFGWLFNLTKKGKYQGEVLGDYMSKSRNNFLYVFACNCNRYGIEKSTAFDWVKQIWVQDNMGFSVTELSKTVESAYKHRHEFATLRLPKGLTT
jgi:hypothetical protein